MTDNKLICACAVCRKDIFKGQPMVDQFIYKCGELSYIELAHKECAPQWEHDNGNRGRAPQSDPFWKTPW